MTYFRQYPTSRTSTRPSSSPEMQRKRAQNVVSPASLASTIRTTGLGAAEEAMGAGDHATALLAVVEEADAAHEGSAAEDAAAGDVEVNDPAEAQTISRKQHSTCCRLGKDP